MSGYDIEGQPIFSWDGRIIVVTNLPYEVRPSDLRDFFAPKGKLLRVDIERSKEGGSNGLGYIEFLSPSDAESALSLDHTQFNGRTIKCKLSTKPPAELIRFYIRDPDNRPINDNARQRIIEEAQFGPQERKLAPIKRPHFRKRHFKDRNDQQGGDTKGNGDYSDAQYDYSYSDEYSD